MDDHAFKNILKKINHLYMFRVGGKLSKTSLIPKNKAGRNRPILCLKQTKPNNVMRQL